MALAQEVGGSWWWFARQSSRDGSADQWIRLDVVAVAPAEGCSFLLPMEECVSISSQFRWGLGDHQR